MAIPPIPTGWPDRFVSNEAVRFTPAWDVATAHWWNTRVCRGRIISPVDWVTAVTDGAPGRVVGEFLQADPTTDSFTFMVTGHDEGQTRIFYKSKRIEIEQVASTDDEQTQEAEWRTIAMEGETQVHPDWQGKGIGTGLMLNLIELGTRIGLERIDVEAADIGRYAWIGMGFLPDVTSWRLKVAPIMRAGLDAMVRQGLLADNEQVVRSLAGTLNQKDPRAIRDLLGEVRRVPGPGPRGTNADVPLLKALMLVQGTEWNGAFDFRDSTAMDLFKEYKDEHETVHPKPW